MTGVEKPSTWATVFVVGVVALGATQAMAERAAGSAGAVLAPFATLGIALAVGLRRTEAMRSAGGVARFAVWISLCAASASLAFGLSLALGAQGSDEWMAVPVLGFVLGFGGAALEAYLDWLWRQR